MSASKKLLYVDVDTAKLIDKGLQLIRTNLKLATKFGKTCPNTTLCELLRFQKYDDFENPCTEDWCRRRLKQRSSRSSWWSISYLTSRWDNSVPVYCRLCGDEEEVDTIKQVLRTCPILSNKGDKLFGRWAIKALRSFSDMDPIIIYKFVKAIPWLGRWPSAKFQK